jgi:hypothetical protein
LALNFLFLPYSYFSTQMTLVDNWKGGVFSNICTVEMCLLVYIFLM